MKRMFLILLLLVTLGFFSNCYATDGDIYNDTHNRVTSTGAIVPASETVTCSAANPGVGVASLAVKTTFVVTDATGASADVITLADGVAGQEKIIILKTDGETTGLKVTPASYASSDVLLEDAGDGVTFVFDGTNWALVSNNGGTIE